MKISLIQFKRILFLIISAPFLYSASASAVSASRARPQTVKINANPEMMLLSLKVIQLAKTGWNERQIKAELQKVNGIFSQCGVQIQQARIYQVEFSSIMRDDWEGEKLAQLLLKLGIRDAQEPALVFAKALGGDLAFAGGGVGGFSFNEVSDEGKTKRQNLAYILETIKTPKYWEIRPRNYSPVAHELVHVLLNSPHIEGKNLMAALTADINTELTASQCETMRRSPLVQSLLMKKN